MSINTYSQKIYYAIQLPCEPANDYNVGCRDLDQLVRVVSDNYGLRLELVERGKNKYTEEPIRYLLDMNGNEYARVVEINVIL